MSNMKISVAALLLLAVVVVESVPKEKLLLRKYKSGKDAPKAWDEDFPEARTKRSTCDMKATLATATQRSTYLNQHNKYRQQIGASNVYKMQWDDSLAQRAQAWAEKCEWKHGYLTDCNGEGIGQNMYMRGGGSSFPSPDPKGALKSWFDEISYHDYAGNKCSGGVCGHFTQLVWSTSTKVGCGYARCPLVKVEDNNDWPNTVLTVCDYKVAGNNGGRPYDKGSACSGCTSSDSGIKCVDGLCKKCTMGSSTACQCNNPCGTNGQNDAKTCACKCNPGFYGPQCNSLCSECVDQQSAATCASWAEYCGNASYRTFMETNCKRYCGFCPGC